MLSHASQIRGEESRDTSFAGAEQVPSELIAGSEWIVSSLADLASFCAFNQLNDVEATLRRALWEVSLQLEQSHREPL